MNLLEAIQGAGENWFRPVGFYGSAYCVSRNGDIIFMGKSCQTNELIFTKQTLLDEWEIVTPEQVLSERKL